MVASAGDTWRYRIGSVDYSPTDDEDEVLEQIRNIGLYIRDPMPWLHELAHLIKAPLTEYGVGLSIGDVMLWPSVTHFVWKNKVFVYPERRNLLGRLGFWDVVSLEPREDSELELRGGSMRQIETVWTEEEARRAAERFTGRIPGTDFRICAGFREVVYTLEVSHDLYMVLQEKHVASYKVVGFRRNDYNNALKQWAIKRYDIRFHGTALTEAVAAFQHVVAHSGWADDDKAIERWYAFLFKPFSWFACCGVWSWCCCCTGRPRAERHVVNPRNRVKVECKGRPLYAPVYHEVEEEAPLEEWDEGGALVFRTLPRRYPAPEEPPELLIPQCDREVGQQLPWEWDESEEGLEWRVSPEYFLDVGRGDLPLWLLDGQPSKPGVHFVRAAHFAVGADVSGRVNLLRDPSAVSTRPGFALKVKWREVPPYPEDYDTVARIWYYQSFGVPGYWPANTDRMALITAGLRCGQEPPCANGFLWDGISVPVEEFLTAVDLPHVDFCGAVRTELGWSAHEVSDQDIVAQMSLRGEEDAAVYADLWASMKPSSKRRMETLFESLMMGLSTLDDPKVEDTTKFFVKGDELLFKAKPRLILFVPSVWWLYLVIWLDRVLGKIKSRRGWRVWHGGVTFYWASGMTQYMLSKKFSEAMASGEEFAFVCGDDNIDREHTADASMYDTTQRGLFLRRQMEGLQKAGLPAQVTNEMVKRHKQDYTAKGKFGSFSVKVKNGVQLPTGAVWTLFLNSLGIIQYRGGVSLARSLVEKAGGVVSRERWGEFKGVVAGAMGLKMKISSNPEGCHGAEFLKGVFVALSSPGARRYWWTPVPSRLNKWAKMLSRTGQAPADFAGRVKGVAISNRDALLMPLLRIWVDGWVGTRGDWIEPEWEYRNIHYGGSSLEELRECAEIQGSVQWQEACRQVVAVRYGLSRDQQRYMENELGEKVNAPGHFGGSGWARLAQVDYLGMEPPPCFDHLEVLEVGGLYPSSWRAEGSGSNCVEF